MPRRTRWPLLLTLALTLGAGACAESTSNSGLEGDPGTTAGRDPAPGGARPPRGDDARADVGPSSPADPADPGADASADSALPPDPAPASDAGLPPTEPPGDPPSDPVVRGGGALSADPASLFFSFQQGDEPIREIILVRNIGDEAVIVERADLDPASGPGFEVFSPPVNTRLEPGEEFDFGLRYRPSGVPDAEGMLRIHHSLPSSPLLIPVSAAEKGGGVDDPATPPCVRVRPTTLDFGRVVRGGPPALRTFTVENCGTSEIRVQRLDRASVLFLPTPASFQWTHDPLPMVLPAGTSRTVNVTWQAGRAGLETGALDVRTNVAGSESVRVNLRGTSEVPPDSELDLRLVLRWDQNGGSDVDFHFWPESSRIFSCDDCYFANMAPDWGRPGDLLDNPFLDRDDLQGPGPENINVDEMPPGSYIVAAHYYSDTGSGGSGSGGSSKSANVTVQIFSGTTLLAEFGPQRLGRTSDTWDVARIEWPSRTITPLNRLYTQSGSGGCRR